MAFFMIMDTYFSPYSGRTSWALHMRKDGHFCIKNMRLRGQPIMYKTEGFRNGNTIYKITIRDTQMQKDWRSSKGLLIENIRVEDRKIISDYKVVHALIEVHRKLIKTKITEYPDHMSIIETYEVICDTEHGYVEYIDTVYKCVD